MSRTKTATHRIETLPDRAERLAPPVSPGRRNAVIALLAALTLLVAALVIEELRIHQRNDAIATGTALGGAVEIQELNLMQ